jgi:FkbM family methyltransferase
MFSTIKKIIKRIIRPSRPSANNVLEERFVSIEDSIAGKPFLMCQREDTWIENEIMKNGLYGGWEKISLQLWSWLSKKSNIIIDIGANTGIYSFLAQNNNANASIIAVEPVNVNYDMLAKNIAQNRFPIKAEKVALSDKEGTATMYMLENKLNYMTSVNANRYDIYPQTKGGSKVVSIQVPLKTFSFLMDKYQLQTIDLVKLDVEGHELAVLNAMKQSLQMYHPAILIEVIGDENAIALDNFFKEIGYQTYLAINEETGLEKVSKLWNNDHANFLVCQEETLKQVPQHLFIQSHQ